MEILWSVIWDMRWLDVAYVGCACWQWEATVRLLLGRVYEEWNKGIFESTEDPSASSGLSVQHNYRFSLISLSPRHIRDIVLSSVLNAYRISQRQRHFNNIKGDTRRRVSVLLISGRILADYQLQSLTNAISLVVENLLQSRVLWRFTSAFIMDINPSSVYTVIGTRNVGFLSVRRRKTNDNHRQGLCGVVKFIKTCEQAMTTYQEQFAEDRCD